MEGFLSLPRSAKGGLAVLLAVALLGWAIVAYSAKRQHDDARRLDNAITTLKNQEASQASALAERASLEERLAAAETELSTSRDAITASRQEKSDIETSVADLEAELADARERATRAAGQGGAPGEGEAAALFDAPEADGQERVGGEDDSGQAALADVEMLRDRLTTTMTSLSAKNAMLQQRDRELAKALERAEMADGEVQALAADAAKLGGMRERLTATMTTLSAKNAMLQQSERELERLREEGRSAEAMIASLEGDIAERDQADRSLATLAAKLERTEEALDVGAEALFDQEARLKDLGDQQAAVQAAIDEKQAEIGDREQQLEALADSIGQEEQRLATKRQEIDAVETEFAELAAARDERTAEGSGLVTEIEALQASLSEKDDAIAYAESELQRLDSEIASAEQELAAKDAELEEKTLMLQTRNTEIQGVEASLAVLKADQAIAQSKAAEFESTIERQETARQDLALLKEEVDDAKAALLDQTTKLDEKRAELAAAGNTLLQAKGGATDEPDTPRSLPQIPIAALGEGGLTVLPIDPMEQILPVQTAGGIRLTLVHFDLGSAELTPGGLRRAKEAAALIKEQNIDKITLVGATDTVGTRANNLALAKRRAQSLLDAFAAEGVDPDRIELISMGEAGGSEIIDDQTAEPLNRCVAVFIGEG